MAIYTAIPKADPFPFETVGINTTMVPNTGYTTTAAIDLTLPPTYFKDDVIKIVSDTGNGFTILQDQAYHQIFDLALNSTLGALGSASTEDPGAVIELIAEADNGAWRVVNNKGFFDYA